MKSDKILDQWLKSKLEVYRPSASTSSRERFVNEATAKAGKSRFSLTILLLTLAFALLIFWIVLNIVNMDSKIPVNKPIEITRLKTEETLPSQTKTATVNLHETSGEKLTENKIEKPVEEALIHMITPLETRTHGQITPSLSDDPSVETKQTLSNTEKLSKISDTIPLEKHPCETTEEIRILTSENNTAAPLEKTEKVNSKNLHTKEKAEKILSLYYRPEMLLNSFGNEKLIHQIGIDWQMKLFNNQYLIGSGLGVSVSTGTYEYAVETKAYLGSYQKLDSIAFDWDQSNFSMTRTLYTSEQQVFDTAIQTHYTYLYRKFIYLQIPLILGYDFVQNDRTAVGLRFSPILSILLTRKAVDFSYDTGNDQLVQINRITPERVQTNWQLAAGIHYSHQVGKTWLIELEPRFTYYFNSVYEKSEAQSKPLGAGIRIAAGWRY